MCGFVGYVNDTPDKSVNEKIIKDMADRIRHRGPDQDDYYVDSSVSLGFRRLSIIDLDGGSQPILNEDGTKVLVFNGEIYNYQPIREELIKKGHVFRTKTDSEVLLHGYEEYGCELLNKLRGMFAFVIWDSTEKKLFGARDIFGIKPFFYYLKNGNFLFGSEIKSFLSNPLFEKELNEERLPDYLCFEYIPRLCSKTYTRWSPAVISLSRTANLKPKDISLPNIRLTIQSPLNIGKTLLTRHSRARLWHTVFQTLK